MAADITPAHGLLDELNGLYGQTANAEQSRLMCDADTTIRTAIDAFRANNPGRARILMIGARADLDELVSLIAANEPGTAAARQARCLTD